MAKTISTKQLLKKKKKTWHKIRATSLFNDMVLGESPVVDVASLIGRPLKINLMFLTNDIKKQQININFRISQIKGDYAVAEVVGFEILPAAIKRMIRRNRDRIGNSIICYSKDGKKLRMKFILITRNSTKRSINTALNNKCVEFLQAYTQKLNFDQVMHNLINKRIQLGIKDALKKTYPLKFADISMMNVIGQRKPMSVKETETTEEKKPVTEAKEEAKEEKPKKTVKKEETTEEKKPEEKKEEVKETEEKKEEESKSADSKNSSPTSSQARMKE